MIADRRPGVDVDTSPRVGPLCHHARNERNLQTVQEVGQTMDRHSLEARIAEDHLVECAHGGIAVVGCLHVGGEDPPEVRDAFQKLDRLGLAECLEISLLGAMLHGIGHRGRIDTLCGGRTLRREAVPQRSANLRGELVVQPVHEVAHVVGDVAHVQVLPAAVAGIEDLLEVLARRYDCLIVRQRAVTEIVDRGNVVIRLDDTPGEFRQLFLDAVVGGHGMRW